MGGESRKAQSLNTRTLSPHGLWISSSLKRLTGHNEKKEDANHSNVTFFLNPQEQSFSETAAGETRSQGCCRESFTSLKYFFTAWKSVQMSTRRQCSTFVSIPKAMADDYSLGWKELPILIRPLSESPAFAENAAGWTRCIKVGKEQRGLANGEGLSISPPQVCIYRHRKQNAGRALRNKRVEWPFIPWAG